MSARYLLTGLILPLTLLALMAAILSCAAVETGPRAWIDWPPNGYTIELGTTLSLYSHAYAEQGVAELHLAVNGQPYKIVQPVQQGEQFLQTEIEWLATEPGDWRLTVTSFETTGEESNPAHVTVRVVGEVPSLILTPSVVTTTVEGPTVTPPTETSTTITAPVTPVPPTATAVPPTETGIPQTRTPFPPTTTPATPPPPTIAFFTANPPSIEAGQCSRLSWAVEGAISAVYLNGEGVGDHDSRERCPDSTTTYSLRAVGPGGERTRDVTVSVTQPVADTQGPPAPSQISPVGGINLGCDPPQEVFTLEWASVSDPSGIGRYHIAVQVRDGSTWNDEKFLISVDTNASTGLACSKVYRWRVRAVDGVGNEGTWSGWAEFVPK